MKTIKLITFLNLLLLFISCDGQTKQMEDEKTKIDKITLSAINGGKGGGSSQLSITKDSIFYENINRIFPKNNKTQKIKTPENVWKKLNDSLNIDNFKLVKSNPGHVQYDGTDATVSLYTKEKKYSVINAEDDEINFEKIKYFYALIKDIGFRLANGYGLNGKSFSSKIGSVCQETSEPNPCAGFQIYLDLNFSEFEVEVTEKEISTCGKVEYKNKYLSEWYFENPDKVVIKKLTSHNEKIIEKNSLKFNFNEKKLIGIATNKSKEKYTFSEKE